MASKNTNKKTKKQKVINLTEDKTSTYVRNCSMNVERTFQQLLRNSNIPVFMDLGKEMTVERYFLNRKLFDRLLGKNLSISDYFLRVAIAKEAARQASEALGKNNEYVYPGYWDTEVMIQSMVHTNIVPDVDDTSVWYLTTMVVENINAGQVHELQAAGNYTSVMNFADYNPNRLYQLIQNNFLTAVRVIIGEINAHYPKAYASTKNSPTNVRIARELGQFIQGGLTEFSSNDSMLPTEKVVTDFLSAFEKPFMVYLIELVKSGGIDKNLIESMISDIELNALYENKDAKTLDDVKVTYVIALKDIKGNDGKPVQTGFSFVIKDMMNLAFDGVNESNRSISMTNLSKLGTAIKKLMNDIIYICTTYAIRQIENEKTNVSEDSDLGESGNEV